MQMIEFADSYSQTKRIGLRFAQMFHSGSQLAKLLSANQIIVLTVCGDERIFQLAVSIWQFSGSRLAVGRENRSDLRISGLHRWRVPGESRAFGHWSGDQRLRQRPDPHREMDWPPG